MEANKREILQVYFLSVLILMKCFVCKCCTIYTVKFVSGLFYWIYNLEKSVFLYDKSLYLYPEIRYINSSDI